MLNRKNTKKSLIIKNKGTIEAKRPINVALDLSWDNGDDVIVYDVRDRTPYVSYYIVASASNDRRLQALTATAQTSLYDNYHDVDHIEGKNDSKWILIDAKDIVVQLFTKEERGRVRFDELYLDCPHKIVKALKEPKYRKRPQPESQKENG
jgi:ribosome-associated protein